MLTKLLKFLTSPINASRQNKPAPRKHLSMQIVYPSQAAIFDQQEQKKPPAKIRKKLTRKQIFSKQQEKLRAMSEFSDAHIEICSLSPRERLIGLSKNLRTIVNGVMLHPASSRYTPEWSNLESAAAATDANIAVFSPKTAIKCLKITLKDSEVTRYLVDKHEIRVSELVPKPQKTAQIALSSEMPKTYRN